MRKIKKMVSLLCIILVGLQLLTGCSGDKADEPLEDGEYQAKATLEGGSGRAGIESAARITVKDGKAYATIVWSSENYDYMIVGEEKILNENPGGNSTFTIPIPGYHEKFSVIADTTAMSTAHEIEYSLSFEPDDDLACTGSIKLDYASQFKIETYGKYDMITIVDSGRFLLVKEGDKVPKSLPEDVTVLKQPLDRTYLVATSAMDLVQTINALKDIRLSGTKAGDWYITEAAEAMNSGSLLYAGKYSAPDYELLVKENCNLAIESTMIYHNPDVKEKLEELGIPVLVERSSYEKNPLGRLEWIKLYGVLFGKEKEANDYFEAQVKKIQPLMEKEKTDCSAAFFSITSNGAVTVRKPNDYIVQMIDLAGGSYVLNDFKEKEENALSTMKMQMEDFYLSAKDADVLIYNSTIEGELLSIDDLIKKNPLFADFKAVKSGRVYCTGNNFFQKSTGTGDFINDLNVTFTNPESEQFTYLKKLR